MTQEHAKEVLRRLYAIFGKVVLLPIPLRSKKPVTGWNTVSFKQTEAPAYQANLLTAVLRGGNIGCRAGEGLVFIDFDDAKLCRVFENANRRAANTLQVRGKRGRQFVYRIKPGTWYPNTQAIYPIKGPDGKPCGEWRCGGGEKGAQSVVYGIHPEEVEYLLVPNDILTIDFAELKWPWGPFWETQPANQTEAKPKDRKRQGDRRLEEEKQLPLIEAYYDVGRKEYLVQNVDGE
jgi:hypothetical protein